MDERVPGSLNLIKCKIGEAMNLHNSASDFDLVLLHLKKLKTFHEIAILLYLHKSKSNKIYTPKEE